jgi:hypothetical protein
MIAGRPSRGALTAHRAWREAVTDVLGRAARRLEDGEGGLLAGEAAAVSWQALALALHHLNGSGVVRLGSPAFIGEGLLSGLVQEARAQPPVRPADGERRHAAAGPLLARLAVSRQLRDELSTALGRPVATTCDAVFLYDPPRSRVPTHVDHAAFAFTFHLVLEHTPPPDGSCRSALLTYAPGARAAARTDVAPGEAVLLRGRGTLHSWERLKPGEHRTLVGAGFAAA